MPTSDNIYSNSTVFKYNVSEEDRQEARRRKGEGKEAITTSTSRFIMLKGD